MGRGGRSEAGKGPQPLLLCPRPHLLGHHPVTPSFPTPCPHPPIPCPLNHPRTLQWAGGLVACSISQLPSRACHRRSSVPRLQWWLRFLLPGGSHLTCRDRDRDRSAQAWPARAHTPLHPPTAGDAPTMQHPVWHPGQGLAAPLCWTRGSPEPQSPYTEAAARLACAWTGQQGRP